MSITLFVNAIKIPYSWEWKSEFLQSLFISCQLGYTSILTDILLSLADMVLKAMFFGLLPVSAQHGPLTWTEGELTQTQWNNVLRLVYKLMQQKKKPWLLMITYLFSCCQEITYPECERFFLHSFRCPSCLYWEMTNNGNCARKSHSSLCFARTSFASPRNSCNIRQWIFL